MTIHFPEEVTGRTVTGTLVLQRPNDPKADRTLAVNMLADGTASLTADLVPGLYLAQLNWETNGITYFSSDRIVAP
jgi:nitrogen fixation protein FixH